MLKTKAKILVLGISLLTVLGLISCKNDKTEKSKTETFTINIESTNDGLYDDYSLKVDVTNGEKINLLNLLKTKTNVDTTTIKELFLNNVLLYDPTSVTLEDASTSEKLLIVYKEEKVNPIKLIAPIITINEEGLATWEAIPNSLKYSYKINNNEESFTTELSLQLTNGDTLMVKAVGDNVNHLDSDYSEPVTYTKKEEVPTPGPTPSPEENLTLVGATSIELGSLSVKDLTDLTNYVKDNYSLTSSTDNQIDYELTIVSNTVVFGTPGTYSFIMQGLNKNTNKEITQTINVVIKQEWLVKFYDLNNQLLYETVVSNNGSVTYKGETPTKEATELKSYTFSKWDKNIDCVTSNLDLYPLFKEEVIAYKLTLICDSSDSTSLIVPKNTKATLATPTKLNHSFEGWYTDEALTSKFNVETLINEDLTLYAKFVKLASNLDISGPSTISFGSLDNKDLTWLKSNFNNTNYVVKNDLGETVPATFELSSQNVNFTTAGKYFIEMKVSYNDLQMFLLVTVYVEQQYTVTFMNENDEILYSTIVNKGENAEYKGKTPTKVHPENLYIYEFSGWDKSFQNVTENIIVKPTFTETVNYYTVTYHYGDNTTAVKTFSVEQVSDILMHTGKQLDGYNFIGWKNKDGEVVTNSTLDLTNKIIDLYANYNLLKYNAIFNIYKAGTGKGVSSSPVVVSNSTKEVTVLNFKTLQEELLSYKIQGYKFNYLSISSTSAGFTKVTEAKPVTDFNKFINVTSINVYLIAETLNIPVVGLDGDSKTVEVDYGATMSYLINLSEYNKTPTLPSIIRRTNYLTITFNNDTKYYIYEYENSSSTYSRWKTLASNTNLNSYDKSLLENTIFRKTSGVTNGFPNGEIILGSDVDTGSIIKPLKFVSYTSGSGSVNSNSQANLAFKGFASSSGSLSIIPSSYTIVSTQKLYACYESSVKLNLFDLRTNKMTTATLKFTDMNNSFNFGNNYTTSYNALCSSITDKNYVPGSFNLFNMQSSAYQSLRELKVYQLQNATVYFTSQGAIQTITYETNCETKVNPASAKFDSFYTNSLLPEITRSGYTFIGWYLDEDFTTKAATYIKVTENPTLYAKWAENVVLDVKIQNTITSDKQTNIVSCDGESLNSLYDKYLVAIKQATANDVSGFKTTKYYTISSSSTAEVLFGDEVTQYSKTVGGYFILKTESTLFGEKYHQYKVISLNDYYKTITVKNDETKLNVSLTDTSITILCSDKNFKEVTINQSILENSSITTNVSFSVDVKYSDYLANQVPMITKVERISAELSGFDFMSYIEEEGKIYLVSGSSTFASFECYIDLNEGMQSGKTEFYWYNKYVNGELYRITVDLSAPAEELYKNEDYTTNYTSDFEVTSDIEVYFKPVTPVDVAVERQ